MDIGDRMKLYESYETGRKCLPYLPVFARLDGKAFHTFTRGMERPYDINLTNLMQDTLVYLMRETNALVGYTQSDELTLMFYSDEFDSQIFFDGKIFKMCSVLASYCSVYFNKQLVQYFPEKAESTNLPVFDCRVWQVPNKDEACNVFLWRQMDATRNSIEMSAQALYSHKQLHKKNCDELQEMIFQKGINWNDYPSFFKRGSFYIRKIVETPFTPDEVAELPPQHDYFKNPELVVKRSRIVNVDMPPIQKLLNREGVFFDSQDPIVALEISKLNKKEEQHV